jgi:hypothetical protein
MNIQRYTKFLNPFYTYGRVRHNVLATIKNDYKKEASFLKMYSAVKGKLPFEANNSKLVSAHEIPTRVQELQTNGFTVLNAKLDEATVNQLMNYAITAKCHDPYRLELGEFVKGNENPVMHTAHFKRSDLIQQISIMDIANDTGVLSLVQEYLGMKPTISNVNMWWSFKGRKKAEEAQNFHRDNDDLKFCKLFVYLTDVDAQSGPHIYVKGTLNSKDFRVIRRYTDEEVVEKFGKENVVSMEYPKGSIFIVDTYGFHKGLPPQLNDRLLLQIQYSVNSIGFEQYAPISKPTNMNYNTYVNRLMFK